MAKTKDQEKNFAYFLRNANRQTRPDESRLFKKYADQFKRDKKVGDKWVPWNTRTDKPWDNKEVWEIIYENRYGTKTPKEDAKVLRAERLHEKKQSDLNINPLSIANRQLSRKTVNEGERRIDTKREQERLKDEAKIQELRNKSSFNEVNPETSINNEPFKLPGEFPGSREEFDAKYGTGEEVGENPWMPQASYNVAMQGGNTVFIGNDTDRVNAAEFQKVAYAADQRTKLSETGGQEYVTDYQTAIQNSRRDGLSFGEAEQYYGEDVLDSAGQRVRKSNVFTEDEDGNPMGVKTRKQRLALDLARAEAAIPQPDKTEVKTDQDDLTTTKTGTVSNDAGTPKGVVEPVIKSPLSDLFDDRVG